jgi:hypothetical protein
MLDEVRRIDPDFNATRIKPQESQIVPTTLDLAIVYLLGNSTARDPYITKASDEPPTAMRSVRRALPKRQSGSER